MVERHNQIMHLRSHVGSINANVFGELMLDQVPSNTDRTGAVRGEEWVQWQAHQNPQEAIVAMSPPQSQSP